MTRMFIVIYAPIILLGLGSLFGVASIARAIGAAVALFLIGDALFMVGVTAALFGWIDTVMGFVIATIGLVFMLMCVIAAVLYSVGTSTPTRGPAHYAYDAYQGLDPKNKEKVHRAAWKLAGFASKHGAKWLRSKGRHRTADIIEGFRFFV